MYRLIDLFNSTTKERNNFFVLFEQLSEDVWHAKLGKDLWSPENIFRHNLTCLIWIQKYLPDLEIEGSPLELEFGATPEGKHSLEEMKKEFERVNAILKEAIEKLSPEDEDVEIETSWSKNTRANLIAGFMTHEHGHFGQVTYIIKRHTGKTDQELRELLFGALKKEEG